MHGCERCKSCSQIASTYLRFIFISYLRSLLLARFVPYVRMYVRTIIYNMYILLLYAYLIIIIIITLRSHISSNEGMYVRTKVYNNNIFSPCEISVRINK